MKYILTSLNTLNDIFILEIELSNQRILHSSLSRSKRALQLQRKEPSEVSGALYEASKRLPSDGPLEKQLARMIEELSVANKYEIKPSLETSITSEAGSFVEPISKPPNRITMPRLRQPGGCKHQCPRNSLSS